MKQSIPKHTIADIVDSANHLLEPFLSNLCKQAKQKLYRIHFWIHRRTSIKKNEPTIINIKALPSKAICFISSCILISDGTFPNHKPSVRVTTISCLSIPPKTRAALPVPHTQRTVPLLRSGVSVRKGNVPAPPGNSRGGVHQFLNTFNKPDPFLTELH